MGIGPARDEVGQGTARARASAPLPTWVAGIVHYRAYDDLDRCAASAEEQTHAPLARVVIDHDADFGALRRFSRAHPGTHALARPNRGFAGGANAVLQWVERQCPAAQFVLLLNPDVVLEPGYAERLLVALRNRPRVALASGKLVRPDGRTLDSAGIRMPRHRRPRDRGADEPDRRQYDRIERVFGVSGAAMMLRREALPDLAVDGEVFDEDFFAYHEDTDLAWRARLLGWEALYVPDARAVHRRRWRTDARSRIEPEVRRHSFKNHYLEMLKNERPAQFARDLPAIAAWELLRLGYTFLRDPVLLRGYADAARLAPRAWAKRRVIQRRAAARRRAAAPASR